MSFDEAFAFTLRWEGGYVNDPHDPGGETKYGISKRAHPDVDIPSLTEEKAALIYRHDYWNRIHGDSLPEVVALVTFDFAVNSGVRRASTTLQRVVNVTQDGVIGKKTIAAAKHLVPMSVAEGILVERASFLVGLHRPHFLKGWMRRVVSLAVLAGQTAAKETT